VIGGDRLPGLCDPPNAANGGDSQPAEVLQFLADGLDRGLPGALCTLVGIDGTAARDLGAQMAILGDGLYAGSLSGGCVEGVVAAEAHAAMARREGVDIRLGRGSRFLDLQLPCGGGIDVRINPIADIGVLRAGLERLAQRRPFSLALGRREVKIAPVGRPGWVAADFVRTYAPPTRLAVFGHGIEATTLVSIARAAGFGVELYSTIEAARVPGGMVKPLTTPTAIPEIPLDRWTAALVLFHDLDWDVAVLQRLLPAETLYLGALGSRQTHAARLARLRKGGVPEAQLKRIKSPIGLFPSSRDARTLALSILADIAQAEARVA
jgi:xanthine dehydrogenase accessory factor